MATQKLLKLTISKVNGPVFDDEVVSVTVPGSEGEMTLLADHIPMISTLRSGLITVRSLKGGHEEFVVEAGTIEVSHNMVTILL